MKTMKTRKAEVIASKLQISLQAQICLINQLIAEIELCTSASEINKKSRILENNLSFRDAVLYNNICKKYNLENYFGNVKHLKAIAAGYDFLR